MSFQPKKSFGQNFLIDEDVLDRISHTVKLSTDDAVLEIGPGQGALTQRLAEQAKEVFAIELDCTLAKELTKKMQAAPVTVINENFLKWSWEECPPKVKVVANIPYNISSQIVLKLIEHIDRCDDIFLTVQYEFAQRLSAQPHTKDYGSLSVLTQYFTQPKILFKIGSHAFLPRPKVVSAFIHLKPREQREEVDVGQLDHVVQTAFAQRRKKLINALQSHYPKEKLDQAFEHLSFKPNLRAENLTVQNFIDLTKQLAPI